VARAGTVGHFTAHENQGGPSCRARILAPDAAIWFRRMRTDNVDALFDNGDRSENLFVSTI
jgi:hypothetical protein